MHPWGLCERPQSSRLTPLSHLCLSLSLFQCLCVSVPISLSFSLLAPLHISSLSSHVSLPLSLSLCSLSHNDDDDDDDGICSSGSSDDNNDTFFSHQARPFLLSFYSRAPGSNNVIKLFEHISPCVPVHQGCQAWPGCSKLRHAMPGPIPADASCSDEACGLRSLLRSMFGSIRRIPYFPMLACPGVA